MTITLSRKESIYALVKAHPPIADIMRELGFKDITQPRMLETAGRIMTLEKGSTLKKILMTDIQAAFAAKGYTII